MDKKIPLRVIAMRNAMTPACDRWTPILAVADDSPPRVPAPAVPRIRPEATPDVVRTPDRYPE